MADTAQVFLHSIRQIAVASGGGQGRANGSPQPRTVALLVRGIALHFGPCQSLVEPMPQKHPAVLREESFAAAAEFLASDTCPPAQHLNRLRLKAVQRLGRYSSDSRIEQVVSEGIVVVLRSHDQGSQEHRVDVQEPDLEVLRMQSIDVSQRDDVALYAAVHIAPESLHVLPHCNGRWRRGVKAPHRSFAWQGRQLVEELGNLGDHLIFSPLQVNLLNLGHARSKGSFSPGHL
mmetsp:Transcript_79813/g.191503  ORF Transcript_79813/g.191503 Transcript_79813/m.191503 type:complete len:233 (+) Transcript_79813:266-964(+)|eukprot:CAMPEP_0181462768 /NCGR_PEP_ID=MMETSP1110-20121109/34567_1 /TAXON_ID=174948 /ORGANISM="Symbiodinium sp., Strain CCMP421" /LENGTH=232 /DNA_ID=CAMNT_0023587441 /DNA_START=270 /DNA_END=968 /DNA_ORIENTATION=-